MITYDHISIPEATQIQLEMREKIVLKPFEKRIRTIAGADISFNKFSNTVFAGIVVLSYPEMELLSYSLVEMETIFPYVSGYLAFREVPSLLRAWEQLPEKPDVLVLDGQGITHPRKMGIASHFGVLENQPTIGCAKSMMFGKFDDLGLEKNSSSAIFGKGELLGYALRTKNAVKPIYISPGNLITVEESLEVIRDCVGKYRIPEPTRVAHDMVNLFRTGKLETGYHLHERIQETLF
ncbi:endonuclease V [Flavobacterium noncentrifugens]|uniref:Endonuclease V n=1 Tax=Flavobacterium noncentrifugens TaxID=1128970 RepID=A0A1G9A174_9FLAO|nr:deoxyribonuclease V [Flavobacterium noncentrifugens]GEP51749.1 endonuclease V [Flavobacterium noncentrifugens]SDK21118.1 Endonuclease V [Flavobacterium noncentrifugens]